MSQEASGASAAARAEGGERPLVRHFVLFNFKPEATPEQRERALAIMRHAASLPMCLSYDVVPNKPAATPPPSPPGAPPMPTPMTYEWMCAGTFADEAALQALGQHPEHGGPMMEVMPLLADFAGFDTVF